MKVGNVAELHRLALDTGAEVEMDGRRFNAGQERIRTAPKPPPEPAPAPEPTPEPALPDTLTREQVEDMLVQRDLAWSGQIHAITQAFAAALNAMPKLPPAEQPPKWSFKVTYDRRGAIDEVIATPIPKGQS